MQKSASVTIPLSAGRSVTFTAKGSSVQIVSQGFVTPRELSEAKQAALQKLADQSGRAYEEFTPRRDPGQPARNYQTRLLQRPGRGEVKA